MKYHKIRNVDMEVCTAEQMIAYNLAHAHAITLAKSGKFHMWAELAQYIVAKLYTDSGKYNIDAIQCALNAGLENYVNAKYHILTSYAEIGKMFPAHYLKMA